jgi:hypothetical protein
VFAGNWNQALHGASPPKDGNVTGSPILIGRKHPVQ